jgi:hypothetical protein
MATRKTPAVRIAFVAAFLVLALALVPAALAGKGGKPGGGGGAAGAGSSISVVGATDQNGNGLPNWGDAVTLNASTTATTSLSVKLSCSQDGVAVLWGQGNYYLGNTTFPLQSGLWTGGAADCTAVLYYLSGDKTQTLATLDFHVDA